MNRYLKSNFFRFIIYPDSTIGYKVTEVARNIREGLGGQFAYCLHDSDVWTEEELLEEDSIEYHPGDLKKPHYHFIARFQNSITTTRLKYAIGYDIKLYVGIAYGDTENTYFRYLLHLDHPDKAQYPKESIKTNIDKGCLNDLLQVSTFIHITPEEIELGHISQWMHGNLSTSALLNFHPKLVYRFTSLSAAKRTIAEENHNSYYNFPPFQKKTLTLDTEETELKEVQTLLNNAIALQNDDPLNKLL